MAAPRPDAPASEAAGAQGPARSEWAAAAHMSAAAAMVAAAHATRGSAAAVAAEAAKSGMRAPVKLLSGPQDLPRWQQSQARADVLGFILALNDAVKSKAADAPREPSAACRLIVDELRRLRDLVATIPPIQQATRYGNKSFRDWLGRLMQGSAAFHQRLLSRELFEAGAAEELGGYWVECFGNVVRIDYGTGHELCFAAWLCVLAKLRVLTVSDSLSIVFDVFVTYLDLMRTVQSTYFLEPAGSKGVWGLDDYQFLPFLWGSAQLVDHPAVQPADIVNKSVRQTHAGNFLYLAAIEFIVKMKSGPFHEHSPMLHDISGLGSWEKINAGLLKMYKGEVLDKYPVIQHFLFGSVLTLEPARRQAHAAAAVAPAAAQSQQQQQQRSQGEQAQREAPATQ